MHKKYNIGLDIGTSSVGWAVVEANNQQIMKLGNNENPLWGVRLFEPASTAEDRRKARSSRRHYNRRRERIKLLQEEFKYEIEKIDANFFTKLKESKFNELKDAKNKNIKLTKEEKREIKEYNKKYQTIYHLRNKLLVNPEKEDIRLVYLALHHIIKYRGNFIQEGKSFDATTLDIAESFYEVIDLFLEEVDEVEIFEDYKKIISEKDIEETLLDNSKNDLKVKLKNLIGKITNNNQFIKEFINYILGYKFALDKMFYVEKSEVSSVSFADSSFDDNLEKIEKMLADKIEILNAMKKLYDNLYLKKIFKDNKNVSISELMVKKYDNHKKDLKLIKEILRKEKDRKKYNQFFRNTDKTICFYEEYLNNKKTANDLSKELLKILPSLIELCDENTKKEYQENLKRIENEEFLPRINETENGKLPYQLNSLELVKILENQGKYYPFLLDKTADGTHKIKKILEFKIPYYVGPLNKKSPFAWLEKNSDIRITPYNFNDIVNSELTAEKFIKRMISHCTYLNDKVDEFGNVIEVNYALPNNSILYSKFKVMNELKQIRVNGNLLENSLQHQIMEELFKKTTGSITDKKFKLYLKEAGEYKAYSEELNITGYSKDKMFANTLQPYNDFFGEDGIFKGTDYTEEDAEKIIEWMTIFEDKEILKQKVKSEYSLNDVAINKILSKKYKGWGSLSKKLLCGIYTKDKKTNIPKTIMDYMYETKENFMQILNNDEYGFQQAIAKYNKNETIKTLDYKLVENLATSPATKRGIYQALKVVEEIIDYIGYEPERIMIEMARSDDKKVRKDDRKNSLKKLYESKRNDIDNFDKLLKELGMKEKIDNDKLFLYFIQEGKCLYCRTPLEIEKLSDESKYEVDHIVPRTLIKDNSLDNKALVCRRCNQDKAASFVLPQTFKNTQTVAWWSKLRRIGLISPKKFYNLSREEYKTEDIQGFINRQLVETRQITKHVANILETLHPETKVVYLKANLSHNYRDKFKLYKFRELNDLHHAHDAYLAATIGEYKEKFLKNEIDYEVLKEINKKYYDNKEYDKLKYGFVINSLDSEELETTSKFCNSFFDKETGEVKIDIDKFNKNISYNLHRNDIIVSKKTEIRTGMLFKATIKNKKEGRIQIKKDMPVDIYGGYTSEQSSFIVLVDIDGKKRMVGVPTALANADLEEIYDYIKEHLNIKEKQHLEIVKRKIPYETLIEYKNHLVNIKGYGSANKNFEVANAVQLKLKSEEYDKYKEILNNILNQKYEDKNFIENKHIYISLVKTLYDRKVKFPLFINEIKKIEDTIDLEKLNYQDFKTLITELLKIYQCNSVYANLSNFNLGKGIGRLSGKSITEGKIVTMSATGLKSKKYEF